MPSLLRLSPTQRSQFQTLARACASFDGLLAPFELAMWAILDRQLPDRPPPLSKTMKYASVSAVAEPIGVVLSVLAAHAGDDRAADGAFASAMAEIGLTGTTRDQTADGRALLAGIERLADASLPVRRRVVDAAIACAAADRAVRIEELELLRAISAALSLPMPSLLSPS